MRLLDRCRERRERESETMNHHWIRFRTERGIGDSMIFI